MGSRIGVLGGTFDPIHLGHLIVAEAARELMALDTVLFVPAGEPWHRGHSPGASTKDRLAMVRLAVADNVAFDVSTVDIDRPGPTYTVDTLEILASQFPASRLVFLLGVDSLAQLPSWHNPAAIFDLAEVVAMTRPESPPYDPDTLAREISGVRRVDVRLAQVPLIDISASDIRRRVADGRSVRYMLLPEVFRYVERHGLYQPY